MARPKKEIDEVQPADSKGETVVVGCKIPNGLILEIGLVRVNIKGSNSSSIIGGHGITEGVNKAFFDEWMKKNVGLEFVKRGFIFAHSTKQSTIDEAEEREEVKTGLEGIDPKNLPQGMTVAKDE